MRFHFTGKVEKEIFENEHGYIFLIVETITSKDGRVTDHKWKVSNKKRLVVGETYYVEGFARESKDKNLVDQNGKAIFRVTFTATFTEIEDINNEGVKHE